MRNLLEQVPTTLGWKIKTFFMKLLWYIYPSETKRSWDEIYHGAIKHNCEFDYDILNRDEYGKFHKCKHHGCNIVSIRDKNDNLLV